MAIIGLDAYLASNLDSARPYSGDIARMVSQLALAAIDVRRKIELGALDDNFAGTRGEQNADGDIQKELDVFADEAFFLAACQAKIAAYASEERGEISPIAEDGSLVLAIDPLDGSSNIDTNVSIGTIFSLLPAMNGNNPKPENALFQPGSNQCAAGFFIYGPQLALVLTLGKGTSIFVYNEQSGEFNQTVSNVTISEEAKEFAINASNYRHWDDNVRAYIHDCLAGVDGPRERNFNMRWIASLVADAYRIFNRGGIFLYPSDGRKGYQNGRLRLVYEANPIAMLVEQAGGKATSRGTRILDIVPDELHQRVPLAFGSRKEVCLYNRYLAEPSDIGDRAPLFTKRGLFRA